MCSSTGYGTAGGCKAWSSLALSALKVIQRQKCTKTVWCSRVTQETRQTFFRCYYRPEHM